MNKTEYIIVGDSERYKGCLVCLGGLNKTQTEEILNKMLTEPNDNDKKLMAGMTNFRIEEVVSDDCWWRHGTD